MESNKSFTEKRGCLMFFVFSQIIELFYFRRLQIGAACATLSSCLFVVVSHVIYTFRTDRVFALGRFTPKSCCSVRRLVNGQSRSHLHTVCPAGSYVVTPFGCFLVSVNCTVLSLINRRSRSKFGV